VCSRVHSTADGRDMERQWTVDWALLHALVPVVLCLKPTVCCPPACPPVCLFACSATKGNGWKYSGACAYDSLRATVHAAVALRTMREPSTNLPTLVE
jgi:hypothetical protein